jgi:hypothetical protein
MPILGVVMSLRLLVLNILQLMIHDDEDILHYYPLAKTQLA